MKKLISLLLALVMVLSLAACATGEESVTTESSTSEENTTSNGGEEAGVAFTVVVKDLEGNEKTYSYTSDAESVGDALLAEGLIAGDESDYGLFIHTVDGITADYDRDNTYWAFYIDGQYAQSGVDTTAISEGSVYTLELTVMYITMGEGSKSFYFTVRNGEGNLTSYQIFTDAETVGEALLALELIEGYDTEYGLFVTAVCGEVADYEADSSYWSFWIDGEYAQTGVDGTEITEGMIYSFTKDVYEG